MAIEHIRMDFRLIHGQVLVAWNSSHPSDEILVCNDKVANDPLQVTLLKSVAPSGVKVRIFNIKDAAEYINNPENEAKKLFVIVKYPEDALGLLENGVKFDTINLGNQAYVRGSEKLNKSVYLTEPGVKTLKTIHEKGIAMTARMMPQDSSAEQWPTIEKIFAKWL
ncbi:MAG: PTS sugar transporter subunit IIB [Anaerolineaceae bacterium]|nr:PTS sugar transporter subunit IIB [Anaerolineaceae bacterium]